MKFPFTFMKKYSISISVLSIALFAMFLAVASVTKAEPRDGTKGNIVSELRLPSSSLLGPKMYSVEGKSLKSNLLQGSFMPLKEGVNVFVDCTPPPHQDGLSPKGARTNYRAVVGLHFSLK